MNKKLILNLVFLNIFYFFLNSLIFAQEIDSRFDYAVFQSENTPYVETYISTNIKGLALIKKPSGKFQAKLNICIQFLEDEKIVKIDKYSLLSPEIDDTNTRDFVFIDQQVYTLNDGEYTLKLTITDDNKRINTLNHEQIIAIKTIKNGFSDIQLIESYNQTNKKSIINKGGYDLIPFISNLYNSENNKLKCYFEYYSENKSSILLQVSIVSSDKEKVINNLIKSKKINSKFYTSLNTFSIENLPSGTYFLKLEARDKNNVLLHKKFRKFYNLNKDIPFDNQLSEFFLDKSKNKDTLKKYIEYLYPIQSPSESIQAKNLDYDNLEMLQKYFYNFWQNKNPFNSKESWMNYLKQIKMVNKKFSNGIKQGFLSDRGRIYLSYGSPNSRIEEYLPRSFQPFEIWHYYYLDNERDVKFIFSNDRMPNEFRLVYTNKSGEINDKDWLNRFEDNYYKNINEDIKSPFDYYINPN